MRGTRSALSILATTLLVVAAATFSFAADPPVKVTVAVAGDAAPGATVTATATVTINDGSTQQSINWTQTWGTPAVLTNTNTATVTAVLGTQAKYKEQLLHTLAEPPLSADQLPPNVPFPEGEFVGGLQNRFYAVGINPFSLEEAAMVELTATVVTSSGTYTGVGAIHAHVPWKVTSSIRNVPLGVPVLLQGKEQASYAWTLTKPTGSTATLADAETRNPEFVPDVTGTYKVSVQDIAGNKTVEISIYAGTWKGIITGKNAEGRPIADEFCTTCHNGTLAPDAFTPWMASGHAEIFSSQIDTSTHYGDGCFACHTVGFDPTATNGGVDEASDYAAFMASGLINHPGDNWTTILATYPNTAKLANIQCENCHGPQNSAGHARPDGTRQNLSSELCATCHGEPPRHGRFQQWQLSGHANYELAIDEGTRGNCARCHTANGFMAWLPILTGEVPGDPLADVAVTWTVDDIHPQTCATCHDPHAIGTTSGSASTNATVRISGDTPPLIAGFTATNVGRGAICITCHNTRRGLKNDATWPPAAASDYARAPHPGAQGDVLMGQNAYMVPVGERSFHSKIEDSCVACHMEATPPPDIISYNKGGTNHTFFASKEICSKCHSSIVAADVQGPFDAGMARLKQGIEWSILNTMDRQFAAGKKIKIGTTTSKTISSLTEVISLSFSDQTGSWVFADGTSLSTGMANVSAVTTSGSPVPIYLLADPSLPKAAWNHSLLESDMSHGVHNPTWSQKILNTSIWAVENNADGDTEPGLGPLGGGAGGACGNYQYWNEIAAHAPGLAGSQWRTDVVARNNSGQTATIDFTLRTANGNFSKSASIPANAQGVFEDIVGQMGLETKGSLEICSNQELEVVGRIFNQSETGTFGQFLDGVAFEDGLAKNEGAYLLALRQKTGEFRTNLSVTNLGAEAAEVKITLYATDGTEVGNYTLAVGSGQVFQDIEPFRARFDKPDLGWGFAKVSVVAGNGIFASASVVDSRTNDATTIPMKP